MTRDEAIKVALSKTETKARLQEALCFVLGIEYVPKAVVESRYKRLQRELGRRWNDTYLKHKGVVYSWQRKDYAALTSIIKQIENIQAGQSEDQIAAVFGEMLISPPPWWLENNFNLTIVNAKFNVFLSHAKKQNHNRQDDDAMGTL